MLSKVHRLSNKSQISKVFSSGYKIRGKFGMFVGLNPKKTDVKANNNIANLQEESPSATKRNPLDTKNSPSPQKDLESSLPTSLKYVKTPLPTPPTPQTEKYYKLCIVAKKTVGKAHIRNKIRRQVASIVHEYTKSKSLGDVMLTYVVFAIPQNFEDLKKEIYQQLDRFEKK